MKGNEEKYVLDAVRTNWISSSGKYISKFEEEFAKFCEAKYGIAVSNGTTALHTALRALKIGPGDEVIVPNFTMIASASSVCHSGAMPVFVDAEPKTWNIDPEKIKEKVTKRTKAIMPVHLFGHPCDMDRIDEIAKKYGLKIVEDAAEAHGAEYRGRKAGNLGNMAAFSFFANKIITTGEGGMIVTNDENLRDRCRSIRDQFFGIERNYIHNEIGFNYRMTNLQAAIGLAQTEKAKEYVEMRRRNHSLYKKFLGGLEGISLQEEEPNAKNVYWMNAVVINPKITGISRDNLMSKLKEKGIDTRLLFKGMNYQPSLRDFGCDCSGNYPVSDFLSDNGFYLPSGSGLKEEEIRFICDNIKDLVQ